MVKSATMTFNDNARRPTLASLPQELIDKIAGFAVVQSEPITIRCKETTESTTRFRHWTGPGGLLSLARVSRRFYRTTIPLFYERNRFIICPTHPSACCPLADLFVTQNVKMVISITLSVQNPLLVEWHALHGLEKLHSLKLCVSEYYSGPRWNLASSSMRDLC